MDGSGAPSPAAPTDTGAFVAPTIGGNANNISSDLSSLAPLATSWGGPSVGVATQQVVRNSSAYQAPPSDLSKFGSFLGSIASETGHIAGQAASWLANNAVDMAKAPFQWGAALGNKIVDNMNLDTVTAQTQQNSDLLSNTISAYKSGQMSKTNYLKAISDISQNADNLVSQSTAINNRLNLNQQQAMQGMVDTGSLLLTLVTGGDAALGLANGSVTMTATDSMASKAADWLVSQATAPFLDSTAAFVNRIALQPEVFNALTKEAQVAIQQSTAEVVASAAGMTATQIAKATAANIALKYPLTYGFIEPSAADLYHQLDNKQYGAAVQNLAFNAMLLLSGGAIGQALKYGGKALGAISDRTFGQTSFWDELSKFYDQGQPSGFRDAVAKMTDNMAADEKGTFLKNLSAVEATNMAATGNDAVAAASRVATGLTISEGVDLRTVTHEAALGNMSTFAEAQRMADAEAQAKGLGKVAVGRVDARALNTISANISGAPDVQTRLALWDKLKLHNLTQAWANNANFDAQIKNLINKYDDPAQLDQAIRDIKAQFRVKGFSRAVGAQLAHMGYIPIKPVINEAPFVEGTGKLISSFAQEGDIWTKSVQPLPVLSSIGDFLTSAGLSPLNATHQVYDMYNTNLAMNLEKTSVFDRLRLAGDTSQQTSDTIIKRLSDYAHNPTSGGIPLPNGVRVRAPITDLRQLTTNDIAKALDILPSQAKEVASALMDSMIQVPLDIRGLGGRIEDLNLKYNPTAKWLARTQGATRFAWNPFFQMKLAYKTEALSQLEAGGKFPTILGTNKILSMIFPGYYDQLDNIRGLLRVAGVFDKSASSFAVSGEGVNDIVQSSANLTHKLLPSQERSIAGLIATQADKAGVPPEQFIQQFPSQVRDTVQAIAQYDRNNSFLNSPMARTLNFAFFPFRFETKVASLTAQALAKTSAMTQFAVIKGLYNGSQFLNSPQGQAWYSQNADVLKLLSYFTPISTLSNMATILGGRADSVGSFGELGGLPMGWIPQLLDAEGLTHITQSAYLDPKTGQEFANYVPVTARGALLTAVQDLVGQLFTYPGAEAGLPSKTSIDRNIALEVTGGNKKQDLAQAPLLPLSPSQQQYQQNIQALNDTAVPPQTQPHGAPFQTPNIRMPAMPTPLVVPRQKSAPKLKKSQFRPVPLP